jgi:hypothetical protein
MIQPAHRYQQYTNIGLYKTFLIHHTLALFDYETEKLVTETTYHSRLYFTVSVLKKALLQKLLIIRKLFTC